MTVAGLPAALGSEIPRHRSRKDRRRWCRGKPGVEHAWGSWYVAYEHVGCPVCRVMERRDCERCGKKQIRWSPK